MNSFSERLANDELLKDGFSTIVHKNSYFPHLHASNALDVYKSASPVYTAEFLPLLYPGIAKVSMAVESVNKKK